MLPMPGAENGAEIESIEIIAWATPAEGWTLDELVEEMVRIGNEVLEVNREQNCLKLLQVKEYVQ